MSNFINDKAIDDKLNPIVKRQEQISLWVIEKIARRIRRIGEMIPSDIHALEIMLEVGGDVREINKEIAIQTAQNEKAIKKMIKDTAKNIYVNAKPYYDYMKKPFIPYSQNEPLQQTVNAIANETAGTYTNMSKAQAFLLRSPTNPKAFQPPSSIAKTYQNAVDLAIQSAQSGVTDYNTAMHRTLDNLVNSGLQTVTYQTEKGRIHHQRLDTAVKRNVLSGIRMVNQAVQEEVGKEIDADGVEISVHSYPAPDHAPIQGHQFAKDEFDKMQNSEPFKDVDGLAYAPIDRHITELNCRHYTFSIILGINEPNYSKEELQAILERNERGYTFPDGNHLTMYQCTQKQRDYELKIRRTREKIRIATAANDPVMQATNEARLKQLIQEYGQFSKACGLKAYWDKTTIV